MPLSQADQLLDILYDNRRHLQKDFCLWLSASLSPVLQIRELSEDDGSAFWPFIGIRSKTRRKHLSMSGGRSSSSKADATSVERRHSAAHHHNTEHREGVQIIRWNRCRCTTFGRSIRFGAKLCHGHTEAYRLN